MAEPKGSPRFEWARFNVYYGLNQKYQENWKKIFGKKRKPKCDICGKEEHKEGCPELEETRYDCKRCGDESNPDIDPNYCSMCHEEGWK